MITEVRAIAADDLLMSPFKGKTCVAFHFTWKQEIEAVTTLLPLIEEALAPFNPRPHWGKVFTMKPSVLQERIKGLAEFKALMTKHDPEGKFRNEFIDLNLFS
jgi:xylitol oxidase